jgi:hypothetical protein
MAAKRDTVGCPEGHGFVADGGASGLGGCTGREGGLDVGLIGGRLSWRGAVVAVAAAGDEHEGS